MDTCWRTCLLAPLVFHSSWELRPHVKTCTSHESLHSASLIPRIVWRHTKLIFGSCQSPRAAVKWESLQKNRRMPWKPEIQHVTPQSPGPLCTGDGAPALRWAGGLTRSFWDESLGFRELDTSSILPRLAREHSKHGVTLRTSICCSFVGFSDLCTGRLSQLHPSKSLSFSFNYIENNILESHNNTTKGWSLTMGKP